MASKLIRYVLSIQFEKGGGGGRRSEREGTVEGQQYTSIVPLSMGATVNKMGQNYKP